MVKHPSNFSGSFQKGFESGFFQVTMRQCKIQPDLRFGIFHVCIAYFGDKVFFVNPLSITFPNTRAN